MSSPAIARHHDDGRADGELRDEAESRDAREGKKKRGRSGSLLGSWTKGSSCAPCADRFLDENNRSAGPVNDGYHPYLSPALTKIDSDSIPRVHSSPALCLALDHSDYDTDDGFSSDEDYVMDGFDTEEMDAVGYTLPLNDYDTQRGNAQRDRGKNLTVGGASESNMNRVFSMPSLTGACHEGLTPAASSTHSETASDLPDPFANTNPEEYLKTIVESAGFASDVHPSSSLIDFFLEPTSDQIASYDNEVTSAVRTEDLKVLRKMLDSGRSLQCANRFGESLVHHACRRGSSKVVKFLLREAGVSLRVRDDFGRTPLHDACWTARDLDFDLMSILVERDPDLLFVSDKRGHTPLSYVRRDRWGDWCRFLNENRSMVVPRDLAERRPGF